MKKFVSILLAVCMCLSVGAMLTACDEEHTHTYEGISEEEWNAAIQPSNFDNVTFAFSGSFLKADIDAESFDYNCKIDGNNATMDDLIRGEHMQLDAEAITALKDTYINTATAIVENFDNFTYDKDSKAYKSNQDIVYTVTIAGLEATITAKAVSVTLDANLNIASIACTMIQDFVENATPKQYTLDITFTYSDYGTTVVE